MKKMLLGLLAGLAWSVMAAEPVPTISLPLNEGDFKAIKNIGSNQNVKVKFFNPEFAEWVAGANGKAIMFKNHPKTNIRATVVINNANAVFDSGKPFTVAMKIKTPSSITRKRRYIFMQYSDTDSWGPGFRIGMSYNTFNFSLGNNERKGMVPGIGTKVSKLTITPDTWYDLICTYDGSKVQLFVDGVLQAEGKFLCYQPKRRRDLAIGASVHRGSGYGFEGIISSVKFYDKALSAAEVATLCEGE